jgi:hypothetical protein
MRLGGHNACQEDKDFAQWLLDVGHGRNTNAAQNIELPQVMKLPSNTVESMINTVYP